MEVGAAPLPADGGLQPGQHRNHGARQHRERHRARDGHYQHAAHRNVEMAPCGSAVPGGALGPGVLALQTG